MNQADAVEATRRLLKCFWRDREKLDRIDDWYRGDNQRPTMPRQTTREYQQLVDRSYTPWLGLVVTAVAQSLYGEGYREAKEPEDSPAWGFWQRNGLDSRQIAVHRAALAHGLAYTTVLPGDTDPVIRGASALQMYAEYADPAGDEWPMLAIKVTPSDHQYAVRLYDETQVYYLSSDAKGDGGNVEFISSESHDIGVTPVVRFANMLDLDGRTTGEVAPFIPLAARIDQDTFDRLVVQRFGAWMVRTIAGMDMPEVDADARAEALKLKISDMLVAPDPDTKFGTLPGTPLDGFIAGRDADIRDMAAVTQTPPHYLLGQMANLSAEALAAAEAGLSRKVEERKHSFGESWEQTLRLASLVDGDVAGSQDFEAQLRWRDMESRSLAQVADALGKLASMLGVPVEMLWEKIPGWTQQDVEHAKVLAAQGDSLGQLADILNRQSQPPAAIPPAAVA